MRNQCKNIWFSLVFAFEVPLSIFQSLSKFYEWSNFLLSSQETAWKRMGNPALLRMEQPNIKCICESFIRNTVRKTRQCDPFYQTFAVGISYNLTTKLKHRHSSQYLYSDAKQEPIWSANIFGKFSFWQKLSKRNLKHWSAWVLHCQDK